MKNVSTALALCLLLAAPAALRATEPNEPYEMTTYQVAFLLKGPAWTPGESEELKALQKAHMEHIGRMAATGKLVIAGPFEDGGDLRGMFIFRVETLEEAKALAEQDPTVKAGRLKLEWHAWFAAKNITVTPKAPGAAR
jgi:uncharacterized protein YciI